MTRIIGPPRSRRRYWSVLSCLIAALTVGAFYISGAQAVHATGIFQLDGDASVGLSQNGSTVPGAEDWDSVCAAHLQNPNVDNTPGQFCHPVDATKLPSPTTATGTNGRSVFVTDACCSASSDDIFKGGTDDGSINNNLANNGPDGVGGSPWQWKEATPSPDKADIEQAFAAEYTCSAATNCTNAAYSGHNIVFFGATRQADDGDTNLGFWFLHNQVSECGTGAVCTAGSAPHCPLTSGCNFSGSHTAGNVSLGGSTGAGCNPNPDPTHNVCTPGDIFVQSAFTAKPTITIYEWVGPNKAKTCVTTNCDLQQVTFPVNPTTQDNSCTKSASDNDAGCAIINTTAVASPWIFQDKTAHSPANTFGAGAKGGELFEGGLDLNAIGFGTECISTFVMNTRSSGSSVNSTDQDLALGRMGGCQSTLTTRASLNAAGTTIDSSNTSANGTASSGTDTATITVTGIQTWSGTVDFYLCGPIATGTCTNGGVKLNGTQNNAAIPIDQSTANGQVTSGSATLTQAGRYCWFSHFTSSTGGVDSQDEDGSNDPAPSGTPTDSNPECFTVGKASPQLVTQAIAPNPGTPPPAFVAVSSIPNYKAPFGSAVYDTGTLSGVAKEPGNNGGTTPGVAGSAFPTINATNGAFAGTLGFTLKGPDTGTPPVTDCSTNATAFSGETQSFPVPNPNIAVTGNTTYGSAGTIHWVPGAPGTYHWLATYTNSGTLNNSSSSVTAGCPNGVPDASEAVTVQQIPTDIQSKQSWYPNDTATVCSGTCSTANGTLGTSPSGGTLDFYLYASNNCTGTLKYSERVSVTGGNATEQKSTSNYPGGGGTPVPANATPAGTGGSFSPFQITTAYTDVAATPNPNTGAYSWLVKYSPADSAHSGSSSSCTTAAHTEQFSTTYTNDNGH